MRTTLLCSTADQWSLDMAARIVARGHEVTIVLLDRGADLARPTHPAADALREAYVAGAEVLVDADALQRRGVQPTAIADGIKPADLAAIGDLLVDGTDKAVWL